MAETQQEVMDKMLEIPIPTLGRFQMIRLLYHLHLGPAGIHSGSSARIWFLGTI